MTEMGRAIEASAQGPAGFPEPGVAERVFRFGAHFPGFAGHFPGFAILPAVVQVLTAAAVAEALRGVPLVFGAVENAKFLLQIGPEVAVSVRCSQGKGSAVEARIHVPEGLAASFRLVFEPPQEPT